MPLSKDFGTRERNMGCRIVLPLRKFSTGFVRSTIGDPDLRSPSGFDSGLSPSAQDDTRGGSRVPEVVRSTLGDPDLRSPSGFDSGLRPPLRMTQQGKFGKKS